VSSAPKNSWSEHGMRTPTRSLTPCASQSRHCANASANPGSSPPWPASGTASALDQAPVVREETLDRDPALSVRPNLTLGSARFLVPAGALLLALGVVLMRYFPDAAIIGATRSGIGGAFLPGRSPTQRAFVQAAVAVLAFLLVLGLVGGWILAGRMLA